MATGEDSKIGQLVDYFMSKIGEVTDEEDWKESEGWIGKWSIVGEKNISRVYEIHGGQFHPGEPQPTYTGEVEMSTDTFLDLVEGSLQGRGEAVFAQKYAMHAIRYKGDQWVVDSERFRKVLKRLGKPSVKDILS